MKKNCLFMGFSLIELMIVVSIISILAALALPSYQRYVKRARYTEVIAATQVYKLAVALALQQGLPREELKNNNHGIPAEPAPTKNVASLKVDKGIITALGSALLENASYILTPNAEGTLWTIQGSCLKLGVCED